jgi:hypothetical protein
MEKVFSIGAFQDGQLGLSYEFLISGKQKIIKDKEM